MLLHDAVDVVLYVGKAFVDIGQKTISNILLGVFAVSYFVLRLVLFGNIILRNYASGFSDVDMKLGSSHYMFAYQEGASTPIEMSSIGLCMNKYCMSSYWSLCASTVILYVMHIYWFGLIIKTVRKSLLKGSVDDVREKKQM